MIPQSLADLLGAAVSVTLVRGSLVFLAALAVTTLAKRLSGETRHLVWLGVIASFLFIPLAWLVLPSIDLGIPRAAAADLRLAVAPALSRAEYARVIERTSLGDIQTLGHAALSVNWIPSALLAAWLAGVLGLGMRLVMGTVKLGRLARGGRSDPGLQSLGEGVAADMSLRRRFRIILSARCSIPFSFGWVRPVIALPADARSWTGIRLGSVLTHELAHLRRGDILSQSAAYAVCVLLWFAPPLWVAYAAMLREAETCCDQHVINRGVRGREYARSILDLVKSSGGRMLLPCISAALGLKTMMKDRITRLLALRPAHRPFRLRDATRVMLICLCCAAPVLAVFGQAQAQPLPRDDPFFGTWVNEEYDASERYCTARSVITPDGHELDYRHIADSRPTWECWNSIETAWVDSAGRRWYRIRNVGWIFPDKGGKWGASSSRGSARTAAPARASSRSMGIRRMSARWVPATG